MTRTVSAATPGTATEACLAAIWEGVLNQHPIGTDEDFFALGGHSLLAVRIVARIQSEIGISVPLQLLFDFPTVAGLATQIDSLAGSNEHMEMAPLIRIPRNKPLPATADQQRLWFMEQLYSSGSLYTVGWLQYWQLDLDPTMLRTALDRLSLRHEPLRTVLRHDGESVFQLISPKPAYEFNESNLSEVSEDRLALEVQTLSSGLWTKPFDLAKGPLLRITMVRLPSAETVLAISAHHAIIDGFSIPIFDRELRALYRDALSGTPAPEPLAIQFADYAAWQSRELEGGRVNAHLKYFADQLADAPGLISLPTDRPRPAVQDYRGANTHVMLEKQLVDSLDQLAMSLHTTRFVILLSAAAAVLSRYSGQEQVVLGITIANRSRAETEPMIGFLVSTIALCVDLTGNPSFDSLIAQVQHKLLEAHSHQDVPFERVVDHLKPERSLSHSPVFQVLVTGLDQDVDSAGTGQSGPEWLHAITDAGIGVARFDLGLTLQPYRGSLRLAFEYATSLFDGETITRLGQHMLMFLGMAVHNPNASVGSLDLLNAEEKRSIIEVRNQTDDTTMIGDDCLHELFAKQAKRTPDRIAISFQEHQLTYAQMDDKVEQIACLLQELGAGPDVCVGICMRRSLDLVIGLHAIHRAGSAYVPLDPDIPAERLGYIAADARITLVLAQQDTVMHLSVVHNCCVLNMNDGHVTCVDGEADQPKRSFVEASRKAFPDNLAYVLYTSGSTGQPKGVMLSHRGVVNRLLWMQQAYPLAADDHVLQKTPFAFDVSVWEFFWPLLVGARLHVAIPDGHKEPGYLANVIRKQDIGVVHFVPSMLQQFLQHPGVADRTGSLRHIVCSGEALPIDVQKDALEMFPNTHLHNLYGPTEASVDVSFWECRTEPDATSVPIGTPVANTQLYILDSTMSPVPDGVAGELFIGGIQLARGYLGRPDLTAERFVANPFKAGRLYATGDLARFRADGTIEYIGRTDYQVKIRGFRIEIGEIEAILGEHPAVDACVVVVHEWSASDKRLTAFLTVEDGDEIDIEEVRRFLHGRLPEYMVPAYFMVLSELPLNTNGKIDRKALPSVSDVRSCSQSAECYVAPRNETEVGLVQLWQEMFQLEQIGVQDDFFELGGHSLLVARMATAVQERWGIELRLATVFQNRTIETLAIAIAEASTQDDDSNEMDADELWSLV
ncbi:Linear gramicidin synthase subunit B [compost metagenome]